MATRLRLYGPAYLNPASWSANGHYLKSYDPNVTAPGVDISGDVEVTADPEQALSFDRPEEADAFVFQTSTTRPLRADGRPNRPLLAFSIQYEQFDRKH